MIEPFIYNTIHFSVVIPLFNKGISIKATIESVLNQTFHNYEILIINDGSTDNSLFVAQSFKDPRIRIINKPNGGVSSARNLGIQEAKNEYITFLDADDYWFPNCLEEFAKLIVGYTEAKVFCTGHMLTGHRNTSSNKSYYISDLYKASAISMARISHMAVCTGCIAIHRGCFEHVGLFDTSITHGEDGDMWFRLSKYYLFAKTEIVTLEYRIEAENRAMHTDLNKRKIKSIQFPNRVLFKSTSEQILQGGEYFNVLLSNFRSKSNFKTSARLIFEYGDWIAFFIIYVLKYRVFRFKY